MIIPIFLEKYLLTKTQEFAIALLENQVRRRPFSAANVHLQASPAVSKFYEI